MASGTGRLSFSMSRFVAQLVINGLDKSPEIWITLLKRLGLTFRAVGKRYMLPFTMILSEQLNNL